MSSNGTPVIMNVNKYLSKQDFGLSLTRNCVWPWPETHFVRRPICSMCLTAVKNDLDHFVVALDQVKRAQLLEDPRFWCEKCTYCVYYHFKPDDCFYCFMCC